MLMQQATLFVYYKLLPSEHERYLLCVEQLQEQVRALDAALGFEILQRPEIGSDGNETWMEVYRHPDGVSGELTEKIHALALSSGLPAQRKAELFIPLR
jgi:hypothetical protein